jgi:hypothetical protein
LRVVRASCSSSFRSGSIVDMMEWFLDELIVYDPK